VLGGMARLTPRRRSGADHPSGHQQAPQEHLRLGRVGRGCSCFRFGNNCRRRQAVRDPLLQPGRHHRGRLPREQLRGHAVPHLGHARPAGGFLETSNYPILQDPGKVSALEARLKAEAEFEVYRRRQDIDYMSDFDREIKRLEGGT